MSSFKDFLSWYSNKDVVSTLEAMQKDDPFKHDKDIDMLKLGCTLPNLVNICLPKCTDAKLYSFTEEDKDLMKENREDVVGGPSIVSTREAVVDETFIRKSASICQSFVGIHTCQLYPFSMCQPMPTGFIRVGIFFQKPINLLLVKIKPVALKIVSYPVFNEKGQNVKLKVSIQQAEKK